jgi:hypothetical protein
VIRPALLAAALLCAAPGPARAAAPDAEGAPRAPLAPAVRGGRVEVDVDLSSALPPDLERQLGNGLTNVVALHVALVPERGGTPLAIYAREVQVLFDVWEETWGVVVRDPSAPRGRRVRFASFPELRRFLSGVDRVGLGPAAALGAGRFVVQARLELNPISRELVERTRELLANPAQGRGGPSRSVLGAFAGYLLRDPPPGAAVRLLRSSPFAAGDLGASR